MQWPVIPSRPPGGSTEAEPVFEHRDFIGLPQNLQSSASSRSVCGARRRTVQQLPAACSFRGQNAPGQRVDPVVSVRKQPDGERIHGKLPDDDGDNNNNNPICCCHRGLSSFISLLSAVPMALKGDLSALRAGGIYQTCWDGRFKKQKNDPPSPARGAPAGINCHIIIWFGL